MEWFAEAQFVGALEPEQLEQASEGAFLAHYQEGSQVLRLRGRLDAQDYAGAVAEAPRWVAGLGVVRTGLLPGPDRLLVESSAARAREWDLLGPAEVAARLGVSTARVRQLEERPDFPHPVGDLAAGRVYRASDVDTFNRGWDRSPGRPRKAQPQA